VSYCEFFKSLTGFHPHPYQERVEKRLRAGDSVILRVPTGAGKTWASVAPFLYPLAGGHRIADRLLYALPLRSLASSLHATVYEMVESVFGQVSAVGNNRQYPGGPRCCSLQIGGQKNDVFFQSDVVFTTIDQLLSGYVFLPVSLPDRIGNINAGALIGSVVVFDEIHLLDSSIALGTVIEMLDRLRGVCQFVLMTATTSDKAISWLANRLGAASVSVTDGEIRALPSQRTKQRTWRWSSERIEAGAITDQHSGGRTIVLFNSVRRAQDLFLDLERHYGDNPGKPHLLLLHAQFYPEHRNAVEDQLTKYFGPAATRTNVILVTTQVIEAGMDISADHLHSELAPMNALIQRAGRTARYEHRPTGSVTVYEIPGLGAYTEDRPLVEATRSKLQSLPPEGRVVDFVEEREWVETVHADAEARELTRYNNLHERREEVHKAMNQGDRGRLNVLVRDIDSVSVLVTSEPENQFDGRAWPRLLSVSGFSLMRLKRHFQNLDSGQWVAKGAVEVDNSERPGTTLTWPVLSDGQLRSQWLVAIHPDFASYHPRLGLRLGEGGPASPPLFTEKPQWQHYDYQFETWVDHTERIVKKVRAMQSSYTRGVEWLAAIYQVPEAWIEQLVEITCALHDVGKLATEWQKRAWLWQDHKDARARSSGVLVPVRTRVPIAHTWSESAVDRPFRQNAEYKCPPHAVQGAFAVYDALFAQLTALGDQKWADVAARCAVTAIARHHGTRTRECTLFRLPPGSGKVVADAPGCWSDLTLQECVTPLSRERFPEVLLTFGVADDKCAWPLYAFLVRHLRLADQAATAAGG
jgi:CRISPR-associated endonuclease/helicase Cas3